MKSAAIRNSSFLKITYFVVAFCLFSISSYAKANSSIVAEAEVPNPVEFTTTDGLTVFGNLYHIGDDKPTILLCHQAGYNRVEYVDIAPKLNELGFNCLAIDQRSGGRFGGEYNATANLAKREKKPKEFIDAQADVAAAVDFLHKKYNQNIIVWGSSYSASLVLFEGATNPLVKAILSFSPGDYFGDKAEKLASTFPKIDKPFFVTSSKQEAKAIRKSLGKGKLAERQVHYTPKSNGFHGSKALWPGQPGGEGYWKAVTAFLSSIQ